MEEILWGIYLFVTFRLGNYIQMAFLDLQLIFLSLSRGCLLTICHFCPCGMPAWQTRVKNIVRPTHFSPAFATPSSWARRRLPSLTPRGCRRLINVGATSRPTTADTALQPMPARTSVMAVATAAEAEGSRVGKGRGRGCRRGGGGTRGGGGARGERQRKLVARVGAGALIHRLPQHAVDGAVPRGGRPRGGADVDGAAVATRWKIGAGR